MNDHDNSTDRPDEQPHQDTVTGGPRATEHPTGEKQAAENAENEPVG